MITVDHHVSRQGHLHKGAPVDCDDIYCRIAFKENRVFETKDSGERVEFSGGMVRDTNEGKPRFDLVIPEGVPYSEQMLTRIAALMARGAEKYGDRNWEKAAGDKELNRAKESAFRHFMQWFCGETDEDHAAAVFFNIQEVEYVKHKKNTYPLRHYIPIDETQDVLPC